MESDSWAHISVLLLSGGACGSSPISYPHCGSEYRIYRVLWGFSIILLKMLNLMPGTS